MATPAGSRLPEEESEREEDDSSSDVTLSDTDLSSEARDDFDPSKHSLASFPDHYSLVGESLGMRLDCSHFSLMARLHILMCVMWDPSHCSYSEKTAATPTNKAM